MDITITGQTALLVDFADAPNKVQRAGLRATNRALGAARTRIVQLMAKDTGLKSKDIRDRISVKEATFGHPEARLATSLKRIPLMAFDAKGPMPSRGRGRGVTYKALGGGRKRIQGAFIAKVRGALPSGVMSGGHVGVFVRVTPSLSKGAGAWSNNLPIKQLFGPSLGIVFRKFRPEGLRRAEEVFRTTFKHELDFRNSAAGASISAGTD